MQSQFVFATCQRGAEGPLKREVLARAPGWVFAFSQPGLVTFKLKAPAQLSTFEPPRLVFARALGLSVGEVEQPASSTASPTATTDNAYSHEQGDLVRQLAASLWNHPAAAEIAAARPALHVWRRDPAVPGEGGFEPGATPLDGEAHSAILAAAPEGVTIRESVGVGTPVMDVILLEPNRWWLGAHTARARCERWPGGTPGVVLPPHAVSRAYLKMAEALRWASLPTTKGDLWIELGCAPGGASQALLDAGMQVLGIDPAEVDPLLLKEPRFRHLRRRVSEAPKRELSGCRWLAADLNVAPSFTLDAAEAFATRPDSTLRGLLLTLKLSDWELAAPEKLTEYARRVQGWGFRDVRFRQLAHNRQEICLAAQRSRAQRRIRRSGGGALAPQEAPQPGAPAPTQDGPG